MFSFLPFKKTKWTIYFLLLTLLVVGSVTLRAQGYIEHSRVIGGTGNQTVTDIIVSGGFSYILGTTTGNDFPRTLGQTPVGTAPKGTLTKLDASGNMVWSRYLPVGVTMGTSATFQYQKMVLSQGVIYLAGSTSATDVPTTNGSTYRGGTGDMLFTKIDANNGNILHNGYLGGSGADGNTTGIDMAVENGYAYITYLTASPDIPVTTGPAFTSGLDYAVQKLDPSGNIVYSTYIGQIALSGATNPYVFPSLKVENALAYLAVSISVNSNFITTDGSTMKGNTDIALLRLDANGNRSFATIIGGTAAENAPVLAVNNGDMYLAASTFSTDYPVTDGSSRTSLGAIVLSKLNSSGQLVFSGYRIGMNVFINVYNVRSTLQYKNGSLFLAAPGGTIPVQLAATDGSSGGNGLMKIDANSGAVQFASKFGESAAVSTVDMAVDDQGVYVASLVSTGSSAFVTDGSVRNSPSGTFITKHSLSGQLLFASYLTARTANTTASTNYSIATENGKVYVSGTTADGNGWPVTMPALGTMNAVDNDWAVLAFCPPVPTNNTISPLSQTICQNGIVQMITGNEVVIPSSEVPVVYVNGQPTEQSEIRPRYQWQSATSSGGPWVNIGAGTQKDYIPTTAATNLYYRRLVLPPPGCGETPVSISPVAEVLVGANASPTVTSSVFNTCVNSAVTISATASGGTPPYTYAWDNGIGSTASTATVTPTTNSVYTITVTDANGCQQLGQAIVNAYTADAGPVTANVCAGKPVRIGTPPPAGLTGVTYSWTPTTGLDDPTAAQPMASPGTTTVYTVQMTVPISGGGTCTTSDNITVNVVAGPTTANFAGPDVAICKGGTVNLGTASEAGFTYTWTPGSYLSSVTTSTTTFNAGTNTPSPNPFTYTLTAVRSGCSFTDQVSVAVLEVDAGEDYCGPRTVGGGDKLPGITGEVYLWEKISGPGTFTGPTNTPTTTVSASTSTTQYKLTVSYLGASCSDTVVVDLCGGGCPVVKIDTIASQGCPNTTFGAVSLRANPSNLSPSAWTYTWSSVPAGGLSATTGTSVTLTDNVERDVTLTITRIDNPLVSCSQTIHVNDPSWSLPVFSAPDKAVCNNTPVAIGAAAVAGYIYTWKGVNTGDEHASDPTVLPTATTLYPVAVEDVGSGCIRRDTVKVTVKPLVANAGPDWIACSNALVTLGGPAEPGISYSWSPQVASYQNGTTYQSSQPQLLVATTQDFTLSVTDSETGCTADSTITITIDENNTLPPMTNQVICPGGSVTIGLPAMTGVTYNWSPATGLSSTTVAQPVASPATSQTYTLSVTYYDAGGAPTCTKTGTVTVSVVGPVITISDASICPSGPLYNLGNGVTVTGATSYNWSPEILVTNPTNLNTTVKANPGSPTTFTLTAKDASGCAVSATKLVSPANTAPDAGSSGFVCVGQSRTIGDASNTGTLSWTVAPAIAGTLSPANGAAPVFTPAAADAGKTFTFTITQDIGGCINTDSVHIQVRSLVLPAMAPQTVCQNAPATIGVPAQQGVTYAWTPSTGLSNPSAATTTVSSVTGNSVYTLTATDAYGCSATGQAAVGANPVPAPAVNIPTVTVEMGSAGKPFVPQVSPMPATYTYSWTPADKVDNPYISNATAIPGNAGTYNYQLAVTDANGCTTTAPAQLNVVPGAALPITLSSFNAINYGCGVRIEWKVEMAEQFSHFVLERSSDGVVYQSMAQIALQEGRSYYSYDDVDPGNGRWVYRLKLVDVDGKYSYSRVAIVKVECALKGTLSVYPNPVKDRIYIKNSKPVRSILLISVTGQVMERYEYNQTQPATIWMPLHNKINRGIYFLLITATDGSVQNSKVMKD